MNCPNYFIIGVGRSGTSLLQSMLNAHSQVAFVPETSFVRRFLITNELGKRLKKHGKKRLGDFLSNDYLMKRLGLDIPAIINNMDFKPKSLSQDIYCSLLDVYKKKENKSIVGDKDPRLIEYLPFIKKFFPNSYVIHIIRDPRDVLLSKMKTDWSKNRPWVLHVLINKIQLSYAVKARGYFGDRFIEIKYEELLQNPEIVLKDMCKKIHIDFEANMLRFALSAKKLVSDNEMQWKKETLGPLLKNNKNKWKTQLSSWKAAFVEHNVGMAFDNYNYIRSSGQINFSKKIMFKLVNIIMSLFTFLYIKTK